MSEQTERLESLYKLGGDITDTSSSILKYELAELSKRLDELESLFERIISDISLIRRDKINLQIENNNLNQQMNELRLMVESQAKAIIQLMIDKD